MKTFSHHIAIVHDSFTQQGGAERVVEFLHEIFPTAKVYTLVLDQRLQTKYLAWSIQTSWLQKLYNFYPKLQYWLLLIPTAVNSLNIDAKIIISSSSSFVKNVKPSAGAIHICYCHTPARFLWNESKAYVKQEVPVWLRPLANLFLSRMRKWDIQGTFGVDYFIANSKETQQRILKTYERKSEVIYPCVNTNFWRPTKAKKNNFLMAGRLQEHKNFKDVILLFNRLKLPLHIAGTGRSERQLKALANNNIRFLGRISDEALRDEYSQARGFIYPQIEDFGLMPIEAACCGTPTLARRYAGSLETVQENITGKFFSGDFKDMEDILLDWDNQQFELDDLINWGKKFNFENFKQQILSLVNKISNEHFS
jgi:glycosyltransferase involved in cell wall biosynthesis